MSQPFQFLLHGLLIFLTLFHSSVGWWNETSCIEEALSLLDSSALLQQDVSLVIHRSGEPEPCGIALFQKEAFQKATEAIVKSCSTGGIDKYQMESILTSYFKDQIESGSCGSTDNATAPAGLLGWCDMGPLRTTIQPDADDLIALPDGSLPCRYFTREGRRISSVNDLVELSASAAKNMGKCEEEDQTCQSGPSLHLYAVPAGRLFMFAPSRVGERFVLDHVDGSFAGKKVVLEVINLNPRLFEIYDFLSKEDAEELIAKTLANDDSEMGLHRSRTGATSKTVFKKRTSENAWDTKGDKAMEIKTRCMEMLGFDSYWSGHTDGLQILRYKNTQAYVAHHDYLQIKQREDMYDYNTSGVGGNRFATILLYMTDLGETDGGETLFEQAMRPGSTALLPQNEAVQQLRESDDPNLAALEADSWEETMTAMCRTRLSIQPRAGRAVLFYSQHPNGNQDKSVLHGGCPVLNGTKWAANLWVWNAPRKGNPFAPQLPDDGSQPTGKPKPGDKLFVTFRNDNNDPRFEKAEIFYKDHRSFGVFGPGESFRASTYKGHEWNIKVDGKTLKTYIISGEKEEETLVF